MDPAHIFYKELKIDQDNIFTANISKENEIKNILFSDKKEYAITGLTIKPNSLDSDPTKIKNDKELDIIRKEIQELIKDYKDRHLTLSIYNPETKTLLLRITKKKKNEKDLPKIKLTCFNTTTEKMKIF